MSLKLKAFPSKMTQEDHERLRLEKTPKIYRVRPGTSPENRHVSRGREAGKLGNKHSQGIQSYGFWHRPRVPLSLCNGLQSYTG